MNNIIDQYGIIQSQINELEETKSKLKAEILARGVGVYDGQAFFAEVAEYDRENISAPLVRKLSDEAFVRSVTTTQHVTSVTVRPNVAV